MRREKQTERKEGRVYPAFFRYDGSQTQEIMSGTVQVDTDDNIIAAWDCDGFEFMWKDYHVDILK